MRWWRIAVLAAVLLVAFSGLSAQAGAQEQTTVSLLYKYDSLDTAVVRSVDQEAGTVTLCQHELGRYYTLQTDNTSMIYDRFGRAISAGLLTPGEVADVTFLHQSKHLNSLVVSSAAWTMEGVTNYRIDTEQKLMTIDGANYRLPDTALLLNRHDGIGERIIVEELLPDDVLTVRGIDREIYSVVVTSGHGYLKLTSTEVAGKDIAGAWLNLDNRIIRRVENKTLVAAPEGDYSLKIVGQGANDTRTVSIERGRETVIDASTIHMEAPNRTEITFVVEPEEASAVVRVDEEEVTQGFPVYLTVGVHRLKVSADGYLPIAEYLKVGEKSSKVVLTMEKDPDAQASRSSSAGDTGSTSDTASSGYSTSDAGTSRTDRQDASAEEDGSREMREPGTGATNSAAAGSGASSGTGATARTVTVVDVSGNETTRTTLPGFEVQVESPTGVEFYLDDNYIGVTPTSFAKVSGQHTVTLAREGYETKSYSIYIDDALTNKTYAFPELVERKEEQEDGEDGDD